MSRALLAALSLSIVACTANHRMSHIRKDVTTEAQWFITGMGARHVSQPDGSAQGDRGLPPGERMVLAVMAIEDSSDSMDSVLLGNAQEMLRGKLSASGYFMVIDKGRQEARLKQLVREQKKESYKACYDDSCQIPLGQALAADSILRATISCLGTSCMLAGELVELEKEAATIGGTGDFDSNDASTLKKAIDGVVKQLIQGIQRTR